MNCKIERMKIRMNTLQNRDAVGNQNIINKLQRRIRALESK